MGKSLENNFRNSRFNIKEGSSVILEFKTGEHDTIVCRPINCSLTGIAAEITSGNLKENQIDEIFSATKLKFGDKEFNLGRVVPRRINNNKHVDTIAISTIDVRIPIDTFLAEHIEIDLDKSKNSFSLEIDSDKFNLADFARNEFKSKDILDRADKFKIYVDKWVEKPKFSFFNIREESMGARIKLKAKRSNQRDDYIVFGSNDYLGLASHPKVLDAAKKAIDKYGFGSTGAALTTGITNIHQELCDYLSNMLGHEDTILFNSGFSANLGIIDGLSSVNDLVIADSLCHSSIRDAMRLSHSRTLYFKHNSVKHLEKILSEERQKYNGCLIVTEGVFSMDGDLAPVDELLELSRKYDARIMVDQAHCFGVIGPNYLGICDKFGILDKVDILMGTFSKIGGSIGGFATGTKAFTSWLKAFAHPYMFSVTIPPCAASATLEALKLFNNNTEIRETLRSNIKYFTSEISNLGYRGLGEHESAVIPVIIRDERILGELYKALMDKGIFVPTIVYPAIPRGQSRFRFTIMANHTKSDIDYTLSTLSSTMKNLGVDFNS